MTLVLFDVDGTLVDSQAAIHECMRRTFDEFGHEAPPIADVRAIIGLSLETAMERLLGEAAGQASAMSAAYRRHWLVVQALPGFQSPLYAGMRELIDELGGRDDMILGVVTGKSRRGVARVMEAHGLQTCFSIIRTADDCPSKPHPAMVLECCAETGIEPAQTFVIGDTAFDMAMAVAAGAGAIGVAWGYHRPEELSRAGALGVAVEAGDIAGLLRAGAAEQAK